MSEQYDKDVVLKIVYIIFTLALPNLNMLHNVREIIICKFYKELFVFNYLRIIKELFVF